MKSIIKISKTILVVSFLILLSSGNLYADENEILTLIEDSWTQYELKNYDSVIVLSNKAIKLAEKISIPGDSLLEFSTKRTGYAYVQIGDYSTAINLFKKAVALHKSRVGDNHPNTAILYHAIGNLYYWSGDYSDGEEYHRKSMAIRLKLYGHDNYFVAANLANLGNIALDRGDFEEAERLYIEVLEIREKTLEPGDREFAKSYNELGEIAYLKGEYHKSLDYYSQALTILEVKLGNESQPYIDCLIRNGISQRELNNFDTANVLFNTAEKLCKEIYDGHYRRLSDVLQEQAIMSWRMGQDDTAIEQFNYAIENRQKVSSDNKPEQAKCYEFLSELYFKKEEKKLAVRSAYNAVKIRQANFLRNGDILPEVKALIYSKNLRRSMNNFVNLSVKTGLKTREDHIQVADLILATKGIVTDVMSERQIAIDNEENPQIQKLSNTVDLLRRKASRLFVRGSEDDPIEHAKELDSLMWLANETEAELFRTSRNYEIRSRHQDVSVKTISEKLRPGSILVEYYRVNENALNPTTLDDNFYAVLLNSVNDVRVVNLGKASIIDSLMIEYNKHIAELSQSHRSANNNDLADYIIIAKNLYDIVWEPVEQFSSSSKDIFVAPDGSLNLLSFAGLSNGLVEYLLESTNIHYLSAGRDLLKSGREQPNTSGLLAMGDPDFNTTLTPMVADLTQSEEYKKFRKRGFGSSCANLSDYVLSPLPATRFELQFIEKAWNDQTIGSSKVYYGADASETNFKNEAPGSGLIYLATHGYYLLDSCSSDQSQSGFQNDEYSNSNPLLMSGLFLAGANRLDNEFEQGRVEDGVLTAYEVAGLDLSGTKLVVLSACETGLGEVRNGEGVYGLRRAFQLAGVGSVISSLWSIPDQNTMEMMSQLFEYSDHSYSENLRKIQLKRLKYLREHSLVDHPVDWAAFIAVGN